MKLNDISSSIAGLNKNSLLGSVSSPTNVQSVNKESFSNLLKQSLVEVNKTQVSAYGAMEGIATGKVENLQEAVKQIEGAELSLKLALEVKNKALGAYKQVMAMQV